MSHYNNSQNIYLILNPERSNFLIGLLDLSMSTYYKLCQMTSSNSRKKLCILDFFTAAFWNQKPLVDKGCENLVCNFISERPTYMTKGAESAQNNTLNLVHPYIHRIWVFIFELKQSWLFSCNSKLQFYAIIISKWHWELIILSIIITPAQPPLWIICPHHMWVELVSHQT